MVVQLELNVRLFRRNTLPVSDERLLRSSISKGISAKLFEKFDRKP
jgi:hypothetical protein